MKVGIIDVGGGMRDIYGCGVFDYLLDKKIEIDLDKECLTKSEEKYSKLLKEQIYWLNCNDEKVI